ncbi:YebC/PmpR family DNA-binding transcriptional regulator [Candidatus Ichthyocystis hellenicum]|uniref:YebC/PmpR family DNA-binding transcriptional regulator n=1 Tax=Candidatus Ichthyocystis hellenicum TaxID=1561003 RepID=UPI000B1E49A4|nr:YebC/PmpR family DNA-binding transcriptional regulator [Candidatus Ichthyocystis hellenicum]
MSGHSKWSNIKHQKSAADAKRGKAFTKIIREITVATKKGGPDPNSNPSLRLAMEKASSANMPKDTVNRAVQRGSGALAGADYVEVRYEGYAPDGAAIIVDCLTDNKIRTVAAVRHEFSKSGGNLGTDGCVSYMFDHCGLFIFSPYVSEEAVMEIALSRDVEDVVKQEDGSIEVVTTPSLFFDTKQAFEDKGLVPDLAMVVMKPEVEITLSTEAERKVRNLISALEDLDDVREVFSNVDFVNFN